MSALTEAEHRQVVDECYQCKLCYVKCPYVPPHEWELDFPRLMSRVHAVRQKQLVPVKERLTDQFLGRTDALGRVSVAAAPVVNWATGTPGSLAAPGHGEDVGTGVPAAAAPYAKQRFTTWFKRRQGSRPPRRGRGRGLGVPDLLRGVHGARRRPGHRGGLRAQRGGRAACPRGPSAAAPRGCTRGNVDEFTKAARRNVAALAGGGAGRAGRDRGPADLRLRGQAGLPDLRQGPDADLVAAHTFDPAEYLMRRHRDADDPFTLRDEFPGRDGRVGARHRDVPRRLPPAGAERRAARAGTCSRWPA